MTTDNNNEVLFSEAPASWNTRYVTPDGFECQLTIRGEKGAVVLEKANAAIAYLLKHDCQPYSYGRNGYRSKKGDSKSSNGDKASSNGNQDKGFCPIHECEMKRWERDGRVWYSHKVDGEWCKGK
jgi:hypothetical protein